MRIIGGHDYYDSALAWGSDPDVVFVREKNAKTKILPEPPKGKWTIYNKSNPRSWKTNDLFNRTHSFDLELTAVSIYFLGVKHNGAKLTIRSYRMTYQVELRFFWNYDNLVAYLHSLGGYLKEKGDLFYDKTCRQHFIDSGSSKERDVCIENGIVIATHELEGNDAFWRINGDNLKHYEFYKLFDPFKAFQEISMFVGGVLPKPGKPMVQITDKSKIKKHGFDKWSFRKPGINSKPV